MDKTIYDIKIDYLINKSLLSSKNTHPLIPDEIDRPVFLTLKDIQNNIKEFVKKGRNLLIQSSITGNGKTEWSKKLLIAWFNEIWYKTDFQCRGLFINMPKFFNELKSNISKESEYINHIKENVYDADIIIWDELGVKGLGDWEHEHFLSYINSRIDNNKANIFTTNLDNKKLFENLKDRLYSRIVNNSKVVELKGSDKRNINKW